MIKKPEKIDPKDRKEYAKNEWWGHGFNQACDDWEKYHRQIVDGLSMAFSNECQSLRLSEEEVMKCIDTNAWVDGEWAGLQPLAKAIVKLQENKNAV